MKVSHYRYRSNTVNRRTVTHSGDESRGFKSPDENIWPPAHTGGQKVGDTLARGQVVRQSNGQIDLLQAADRTFFSQVDPAGAHRPQRLIGAVPELERGGLFTKKQCADALVLKR